MTISLSFTAHDSFCACRHHVRNYFAYEMDAVKDTLSHGYNTAKRALSTAPPNDAYLRWNAPGVEQIKPDEEIKAQQIGDTMNKMQQHNFDKANQFSQTERTDTDPPLASARLYGYSRQDSRPCQRYPHCSPGSPSSPPSRPVRNPRDLSRRSTLRERACLPPG